MISKLKILNFQSHRKSILEFDKGVNVIIGKTDSGKTAIIRALRWVINNRPGGDGFRSNWGGKTKIDIITHEGNKIARIKDKGVNRYILNETEFNAFGASVPDEVSKALNIKDGNLQFQFDQPFLLSSSVSPGEIAKHFNKIAHIDQIDIGNKKVKGWITKITQSLAGKETSLKESIVELEDFSYLEKFEIELEVLEGIEKTYHQIISQEAQLKNVLVSLDLLKQEIKDIEEITKLEKPVDSLLTLFKKQEDLVYDFDQLEKAIQKIEILTKIINDSSELLPLEEPVKSLLLSMTGLNEIIRQYETLGNDIFEIEDTETKIWSTQELLITKQKDFKKNMPEICPLCGQKIN